ncbi:uncharacterized protein LOC134958395 isoform X2 [Pseudophryne corroboree]
MPMIQLSGLICLAAYISLECLVPHISWMKTLVAYWYRKQQEDLILREVEIIALEKVDEKRKAFLENMMSPELDKLSLEETHTGGHMSELVWHYKYNTLQAITGRKDSGELQSEAEVE